MLTELEFQDKTTVIMDKFDKIYIMTKNASRTSIWRWYVYEIEKGKYVPGLVIEGEAMTDKEAYEFYKERMESFGYKPFQVISE